MLNRDKMREMIQEKRVAAALARDEQEKQDKEDAENINSQEETNDGPSN